MANSELTEREVGIVLYKLERNIAFGINLW